VVANAVLFISGWEGYAAVDNASPLA